MTMLNFKDVDQFRKQRLLVSVEAMASLFGISRMTYYRWTKGEGSQPRFDIRNRETMARLLEFVRATQWPDIETKRLTQAQRSDKLLAEFKLPKGTEDITE